MSESAAPLTADDATDASAAADRMQETDYYLRAIAVGVAAIAAELRGITKATYNLGGV